MRVWGEFNRNSGSTVQDKPDHDPLSFLNSKDREVLRRLSDIDGLSEEEELSLLIRSRIRAIARLARFYEKKTRLFEGVHLKDLEIEPEPE
jgi:hypothetical protein